MADGKKITLKIILIGNSGVGKSSFTNRYVNHHFSNSYRPTIGTDFLPKTVSVDGEVVNLQIWDTAGTENFHSLGTPLYRGAHCCLLVFDVTSRDSFSALAWWRDEFLARSQVENPEEFPFIVVGNKTDQSDREVTARFAQQWSEAVRADYFEASAKEDVNVVRTFQRASERALRKYKKHTLENTEHFQITCKQPKEAGNNCQC
ncbi:ras-related protein rab7 [Neosynchiropus ocellatus]